MVSGSCNNDSIILDWHKAKGASLYEVTISGHLGYTDSIQTNDTIIQTDLPCGQMFNLTVLAKDDRCDSIFSSSVQYKTGTWLIYTFSLMLFYLHIVVIHQYPISSGPCVPMNVQSFTRCENSLGSVSWSMKAQAERYMAIAIGKDGQTHGCITNNTICTWNDLHCGEVYTVNVIAYEYSCTSMPSNSTTIRMGKQPLRKIYVHLQLMLNC